MIKRLLKENLFMIIILIIIMCLLSIIMLGPLYKAILMYDEEVIYFCSSIRTEYLTDIFSIITNFGDWYIPFCIIVCILVFLNKKKETMLLTSSYLLSASIMYILKTIVARPRPIEALIQIPQSYSFPSGHTLTSIVFYMTLWNVLTYKSSKYVKTLSFILFLTFSLLIAGSRVYLGVHYFSDVVGGIVLSIPIMIISVRATKRVLG